MALVDARKAGNTSLGVLADYAAMLALSEPKSLGQCNVLPSITDLYAGCPGRPAPTGLTAADIAYLTALYTAQGAVIGESHQSHVIQRMADLLIAPTDAADGETVTAAGRKIAKAPEGGSPCMVSGSRIPAGRC